MLNHLVLFCFAVIQTSLAYSPWLYNGTTPNLESIVKGRCTEFQVLNLDNRDPEFQVKVDCNKLWDTFTSEFKNKDPCQVDVKNLYSKTFELIDNKQSYTDNTLFWSGTREVVHDFTSVNSRYNTLEDTFPGFFANNLRWCGCKSGADCTGGINYKACNKSCDITVPFWNRASNNFALKAKGIVSVLINGTTAGNFTAYWPGSYFGREELPTLGEQAKKGIVKSLEVYVINDLDTKPKEKCGEGTVEQLVKDAHNFSIKDVKCIDEPLAVKNILCAKYPNAKECQPIKQEEHESWKEASIALIVVSTVLLIAVILLLILYNKRRTNSSSTGYTRDVDA